MENGSDQLQSPNDHQDVNFDHLAQLFKRRVYSGTKGRLRLAILQRDLVELLPDLFTNSPSLRVLDAGAGEGMLGLQLARAGHRVLLCDHSEKMLSQAERQARTDGIMDMVELFYGPIQALPKELYGQFDLVLCHAVLEWVVQPQQLLMLLSRFVNPYGHLSLMFYNAHSTVFRSLIRGYLQKAIDGQFSGNGQGLTPINPLLPSQVKTWCQHASIEVLLESGVRVFHDYMHKDVRDRRDEQDILELELRYSRQEPYRAMGRYYHLMGSVASGNK